MSEKTDIPAFVLKAPTDFWWPVLIPVPDDGDYRQARLDVLFKALPQQRLDQFVGKGLPPGQPAPTDDEVVREVVRGWRHLADEAGNPVPFSAEALERLLAVAIVRSAMVATFMAASSGMAARKNA